MFTRSMYDIKIQREPYGVTSVCCYFRFNRRREMDSFVLWKYVLVVLGCVCVGAAKVSMSVKEGDSVTLNTDVEINQQKKIRWYVNDTLIAQINADHSKICTDVQCNNANERYRDRLKLDHQTGSLNITNIRTTDSGDYILEIIDTGSDSEKIFKVTVYGVFAAERDEMKGTSVMEGDSDSGLSRAAVAGICVAVLLIVAAAGVIYYRKHQARQKRTRMHYSNQVKEVTYSSVNRDDNELAPAANELSHNGNANSSETSD